MGAQRQLGKILPGVLLDWLRPRLSETQIMVFTAFLAGIGSGFGAVAFRKLINLFTWVFFGINASVAVPLYRPESPIGLPLYVPLGLLAGCVGIL